MIRKRLTVGILSTNCYIVGCPQTKEAIIIDPGFDRREGAERVLKEVDQRNLRVQYIVNTHGHPDHVAGNGVVKEATGAPILIHGEDAPMLTDTAENLSGLFGFQMVSPPADKTLQDNDVIKIGEVVLRVLHTPGHSRGSICLLGEDVVFTGDTLFAGSIGRTDLPGSSRQEILRSLRNRLMPLPDHLRIYPGHGLSSTMGREKRFNPYLSILL
ncbi:MAG: MBL fold metallo-hydrolase [Candidatus Bathyarchaeia archaeon]